MATYQLTIPIPAIQYDDTDPGAFIDFVNAQSIEDKTKLFYENSSKAMKGLTSQDVSDTDYLSVEDGAFVRYEDTAFEAKYTAV